MKTFALSLLLFVGSFDSIDSFQLLPTRLKITVINGLGNIETGATVTIFKSKDDYLAESNPVASSNTNEKGKVIFKKLDSIPYYVLVTKGEMNNNGEGVVTAPLREGRINRVNIVIE